MADVYMRPDYQGTQTEPYTIYFSWTERLPNTSVFDTNDITVTNGTLSDFSFDFQNNELTTYRATITPPTTGSGNTTITVAANVYDSNTSTTETIPYAQSATNTIKIYTAPSGTRSGPFWVYIVIYISPVILRDLLSRSNFALIGYLPQFTESDISVTNGTMSNYDGVIVPEGSSFGDASVKFLLTPNDGVTSTTITVQANAIGDNPETTLTVPISANPVNVESTDADIPSSTDFIVDYGFRTNGSRVTIIGNTLYSLDSVNRIHSVNIDTGETNSYTIQTNLTGLLHGIAAVGSTLYILRNQANISNTQAVLQRVRFSNNLAYVSTIWTSNLRIGSRTIGAFSYYGLTSDGTRLYSIWNDFHAGSSSRRSRVVTWTTSGSYSDPGRTSTRAWVRQPSSRAITYYNGYIYFTARGGITEISDTSYSGLYRIGPTANANTITRVGDVNFSGSIVTSGNNNYAISGGTIYNLNITNGTTTRYRSPANSFLSTSDTVVGASFTAAKRYFVLNKTAGSIITSILWRFNNSNIFETQKDSYNTTIHDICAFNDDPYIIYRFGDTTQPTYLGRWGDNDVRIVQLATLDANDSFVICYNNNLFVTDNSVTTFKCYSFSGTRLTQNDFSLVHTETRGIIKSLSSNDEGINITHRLGNRTLIYRYNTRGLFIDSISVSPDPSTLLLKATDLHNDQFFVLSENLVLDGTDLNFTTHEVALEGPEGIEYLGPEKIVVRNFEPIDLKPLFTGETSIQEGIGVLLDIDHTFENGVLALKFIRGRDPFFGATEIFFPFVPLSNTSFSEQEIYFAFQERLDLPIPNEATEIILEQPDIGDLHEFFRNAETITVKTGTTLPAGVTVRDNKIFTTEDAVTEDTRVPAEFTATNPIGSLDKKLDVVLLNSQNNLRIASHFQKDIIEKVFINDEDITEFVDSVSEIDLSLDTQFLNVQKVSEATIVLNDPEGYFSSGSYSNFFSDRDLNRSGFNVPISIQYGYQTDIGASTRILFFGRILRVSQETGSAKATIVAIDYSSDILSSSLQDFGVSKKIIYTSSGLIGKYHGEYNLSDIFLPISDQSLVGRARNFAILRSQNKNSLKTEGIPNWSNIKVSGNKIESEGELIPYPPIFSFKSPYRYLTIDNILRNLLTNQNIFNYRFDLVIPEGGIPNHFQNVGSPVYQYEESQKFYTRDWFRLGNDSYYLLGALDRSENDKFIKKQENKVITNLFISESNISLWKVAIEQTRNILWIWATEKYVGDSIPLGTFDSSESNNKTRLLKYEMNTDNLSTQIASNHTNVPQLAHRYILGERGSVLNTRLYSIPDNRINAVNWYDESIGDYLFYKFANSTHFGIANFDLVNETVTQIINEPNDTYGNSTCFDLTLQGDSVFFAYTTGTANSSTLYIKEYNVRTSTTTTFYQSTTDYTNTDFFDEISNRTGAIYNGVLEIFATTTHVYANVQLQKEDSTDNTRSFKRNAGAILYKIPRTGTTNPTVNNGEQYKIKLYEFVQLSPHSFVLYNDNVHFFEGSPHLYKYKPILANGEEANWRNQSGLLQYEEADEIKSLGIAWRHLTTRGDSRYDNIYGAIDSPIRVIGSDLHMFLGKDDVAVPDQNDIIGDYEEIVYSDTIQPVVPILETNGKTVLDLLNDINQTTYTFSRFENNKLVIQSKLSKTADFVGISGTTLTFKNLQGEIPIIGYIKIGQEFIAYNGKTETTILNIERNRLGTISRYYPENEDILFFDHIIDGGAVDNPILDISFQNDYNFLANTINVNYGQQRTDYLEDVRSITTNDRKEAEINTLLDDHQKPWAENIGSLYLEELKDLKQQIQLSLKPSFFLRLGETVILRYPDRAEIDGPCRITRLQFGKERTNVTLKTLNEEIVTKLATVYVYRPQNGLAFDRTVNRLYFHTRWNNIFAYIDAKPNGEIIGLGTRWSFRDADGNYIPIDWEVGNAIRGRNMYVKDTRFRLSTTTSAMFIRNLDTDITTVQYFDKTNRNNTNIAYVIDDDENIYVGEDLSGQNILRRVVPVDNPSETNLMTIPGDYILLEPRRFSNTRDHIVNVIGTRSLTWYNGSIWGIDEDNKLIVEMKIEDIEGTNNKRAVISENFVEIPDDIVRIGDIARGRNCWYVNGDDGTTQVGETNPNRKILWLYTIQD